MASKFGGQALQLGAMNLINRKSEPENKPGLQDDWHDHPFKSGAKTMGAVAALTAPNMGNMANRTYTALLQGGQFH
jgi:hypothetical protein